MRTIQTADLKPHPLNAEIYQEDVVPPDFLESIRRMGILNPLVILEDGTIISGHRRYRAAKELDLKYIPAHICKLEDPLDIGEAIIESNRQREKTFSQKMREAEMLEKIEATRARERQGTRTDIVQTFAQSEMGKSRDKVAEKVGIGSGEQYRKAKKIWGAAKEGDPVAQDQVSKLDADEITIHAANRILAKKSELTASCHNGIDPVGYDGDEWFTPLEYVEAARQAMGSIDLDPATRLAAQEKIQAQSFFTKDDDGLMQNWWGNVWLNPPYSGSLCPNFIAKTIEEFDMGNIDQAIILVNNSTETTWFQSLLARFPVCFIKTRLKFWRDNGEIFGARQGQAFFYLGNNIDKFKEIFSDFGIIMIKMD